MKVRIPRKIKKKIIKLSLKDLVDFNAKRTMKYYSYQRSFYIGLNTKTQRAIGLFKRK